MIKDLKTEGTKEGTQYSGDVMAGNITVLDTPGWWKYFSSKFIPKCAQTSILESIGRSRRMQYPPALILVIPIDTSFRNEQKTNH